MIYLYVRHSVSNYARWKERFDIHFAARQAGGATREAWVLRNVDDPYEIVVVMGWRDVVKAQTFIQSVSWQMVLQEMRVIGVPEVLLLERVD